MTIPTVEQLNNKFSFQTINNSLHFKMGEGDIPLIEITNEYASALISLQGAHLLSWKPTNEQEVIWLSDEASFSVGKSVRGGIPICWPWFGAHETNTTYPAHGFARTVFWQVTNTALLKNGDIEIHFKLETNELPEKYQQMWPQNTTAEYIVTIGKKLNVDLITTNNSSDDMTIGQALHTYFAVDNVSATQVSGLEDKSYLDKPDNFKQKKQTGAIHINEEVDRIYLNTTDEITIDDTKRKINIKKQGSASTVVWNPWKAVAEKMGDLGDNGYLKMLCVESANAADDVRVVKAGDSHKLSVIYSV